MQELLGSQEFRSANRSSSVWNNQPAHVDVYYSINYTDLQCLLLFLLLNWLQSSYYHLYNIASLLYDAGTHKITWFCDKHTIKLQQTLVCHQRKTATENTRKEAFHGLWYSADLKMLIHAHFIRRAILTRKVCHINLVLVCDQGSLVGLCMQNYKSLCAAVMICASLVNIKT